MRVLGKLSIKVAAITTVLGCLVGVTAMVAWNVFSRVESLTTSLTDERLPQIQAGFTSSAAANDLRGDLLEMLLAPSPDKLERASTTALARLKGLQQSEELQAGATHLMTLEGLMTDLRDGLQAEFETKSQLVQRLTVLDEKLEHLTQGIGKFGETTLETTRDSAKGNADTIVGDIETLVVENAATMRIALQIRAEYNRAAGFAMAYHNAKDPGHAAVFADLTKASLIRLKRMSPRLLKSAQTAPAEPALLEGVAEIEGILADSGGNILTKFDELDIILANVVDDVLFDLTMMSESMAAEASALLTNELTNTLSVFGNLIHVQEAIEHFLVATLDLQNAETKEIALSAQARLVSTAEELSAELSKLPDFGVDVDLILREADAAQGIIKSKLDAFAAEDAAQTSAREAFIALAELNSLTNGAGNQALLATRIEATDLKEQILSAQRSLMLVGAICVAVYLGMMLASRLLITRPFNMITDQTKRLAEGNTDEIPDMSKFGGEVAELNQALRVFRDGQIEQSRLAQNAKDQEACQKQAEAEAEQARRAQEEEKRLEKERMAAAARVKEAEEAEAREEMRLKADNDRKALLDAQESVVKQLASGLRDLASGDLTSRIKDAFPEDQEELRSDFNSAMSALSDAMQFIVATSREVEKMGQEISTATDDVAHRTESSAATLEETAAALEQLTSSVKQAAGNAQSADQLVASTSNRAEESGHVVRQAVEAMGQIEQSSEQISKIIHVIDDIAFQTNLLALNAGVEAARAGEAGRGFAVVASEVRALAQRASEAANEINGLIMGSGEHVRRGVELVGEAGRSLESIVSDVKEVSGNMTQIAASASEQATGLSELNVSVSHLDEATQQNAAKFHETMAAGRTLVAAAKKLSDAVSQFELGDSIAPVSDPVPQSHSQSQPSAAATSNPVKPNSAKVEVKKVANGPDVLVSSQDDDGWEDF